MGVSFGSNKPALGAVGWASGLNSVWTTLEDEFVSRHTSTTTSVTVTGTTSETALITATTIAGNSLVVGQTVRVFAAGTITIPASASAVPVTFRLQWGGLAGAMICSAAWNYGASGSPYTVGWCADFKMLIWNTGVSGNVESDGFHQTTGALQAITGSQSIDTTTNKVLCWTVQPSSTSVSCTQRVMGTDVT